MKNLKFIVILFIVFASQQELSAQWSVIPGTNHIYNAGQGSVLVGGTSFVTGFGGDKLLEIQSGSNTAGTMLSLQSGSDRNTSNFVLGNWVHLGYAGIFIGRNGTGTNLPFVINVGGAHRMRFLTNGQIVIGTGLCDTPMPADGLLAVNGSIYAKAVKIKIPNASNCFPDFVFASNYKLASLEDVEKYIKENKHLPEVPSASDVEKDGINVAEMDALLLQKIEELTLYIIELKKEVESLKRDSAKN